MGTAQEAETHAIHSRADGFVPQKQAMTVRNNNSSRPRFGGVLAGWNLAAEVCEVVELLRAGRQANGAALPKPAATFERGTATLVVWRGPA